MPTIVDLPQEEELSASSMSKVSGGLSAGGAKSIVVAVASAPTTTIDAGQTLVGGFEVLNMGPDLWE